MRPRPFILLDLYTQAEFVPQEIRRWPRDRILAWFRLFGEVREFQIFEGHTHATEARFIAPTGLAANFILYDDGRLYLVGDHTMWVGWE